MARLRMPRKRTLAGALLIPLACAAVLLGFGYRFGSGVTANCKFLSNAGITVELRSASTVRLATTDETLENGSTVYTDWRERYHFAVGPGVYELVSTGGGLGCMGNGPCPPTPVRHIANVVVLPGLEANPWCGD